VVFASVKGQEVTVKGAEDAALILYLNDELLNLDEPVKVIVDGKEVHNGRVKRTAEAIRKSLKQRLDPAMAATAILPLKK
jgi:hypothetical protein